MSLTLGQQLGRARSCSGTPWGTGTSWRRSSSGRRRRRGCNRSADRRTGTGADYGSGGDHGASAHDARGVAPCQLSGKLNRPCSAWPPERAPWTGTTWASCWGTRRRGLKGPGGAGHHGGCGGRGHRRRLPADRQPPPGDELQVAAGAVRPAGHAPGAPAAEAAEERRVRHLHAHEPGCGPRRRQRRAGRRPGAGGPWAPGGPGGAVPGGDPDKPHAFPGLRTACLPGAPRQRRPVRRGRGRGAEDRGGRRRLRRL